jgi:hypothetical protein
LCFIYFFFVSLGVLKKNELRLKHIERLHRKGFGG